MDSFFGIGLFELVMIAVIALLVLGPERLPGAMREVAKYMKQLRNLSNEFQSQFSDELKMLDEINPRRILNEAIDPNSPSATAAKPAAKAAAATAATTAAKPLAPKSVTPKPAAPAPAITNGEPANTILPPAQADTPPGTSTATTDPAASGSAEGGGPAPENPPPADRSGHNDSASSAPAEPGAEASQ
jgi:sec-independent protein translocase protein TatB